VVLVLAAAAAPSASAHSFAVRGDQKLGAYAVRADGSLAGAIRAFGTPSSTRRTGVSCLVVWSRHGLTVTFYNLGGDNPCSPAGGRFSRAILRGDHWLTTLGLRVGEPVSKLRRLYPRAPFRRGERHFWPSGYWLLTRTSPFGEGGGYPGLLAETARGRVVGYQVRFPAGGD
jgi:hypothetical protein